jgi:cation-transporting ATPase 13A1
MMKSIATGAYWQSVDGQTTLPFDRSLSHHSLRSLTSSYNLCVTGSGLDYLLTTLAMPARDVARLVCYVMVFARTSPDQKEFILTWLKNLGFITMMCGDGTNDVGALKQAHVGMSLFIAHCYLLLIDHHHHHCNRCCINW